jgi:glycerol-3-phosphate cytidylyltransferase
MKKECKLGFFATTSDLCHTGHLVMFEEARKHCDYLIAGLNVNPCDRPNKNKPIESVFERYMRLRSIKWIDEIICYEGEKDLELLYSVLDIDIAFLGQDHKCKDYTGKKILEDRGIEVYFCKRYHNLSSTNLRERIYQVESKRLAKSTKRQSSKSQEDCFYGFIDYMLNKNYKSKKR